MIFNSKFSFFLSFLKNHLYKAIDVSKGLEGTGVLQI